MQRRLATLPRASALLLGVACLLSSGCVSAVRGDEAPGRAAIGPVFLVHGIWPDGVDWWCDDVEAALRRQGVEGIRVPHTSFVAGYLFGFGTDLPADRLADFERKLRVRHRGTGCPAPLRLCGVGFSAGTEVLTKAAERGVRFERVYFAGSPLPVWSQTLARPLREGRILNLVNYHSPVDLVTLVTFGSGIYGYRGLDDRLADRVENRLHWRSHAQPLWDDEEVVEQVAAEIADLARGPAHTCFDHPEFWAWYQEATRKLRDL